MRAIVQRRLRSTKKAQEKAVLQMPLKEVQAALQVWSDRHIHPGPHALYYQLFSIDKERGLFTETDKEIENKEEILLLLEAMWEPAALAVMHCRGHQWSDIPQEKGNCLANQVAKQEVTQDNRTTKPIMTPVVSSLLTAQMVPVYDKENNHLGMN